MTNQSVGKYYRFYGARHSVLQKGYLIDFEIEESNNNFLPRVRNILHNGFIWLYDKEKLILWHKFISIFENHLRDVTSIDTIYYDTLLDCAKKWHLQSPKRLIVEAYIKIIKYEGRLFGLDRCVMCNQALNDKIALIDKFMPTHFSCSNLEPIRRSDINYLFDKGSTIKLDDNIIDRLYLIALKSF